MILAETRHPPTAAIAVTGPPERPGSMGFIPMMAAVRICTAALLLLSVPANAADGAPDECGIASVYSSTSEETASGEDTLAKNFTAAHRTLPFGSMVRVDNLDNGRSTVVRITDRGPFIPGRIIDVSRIAARDLGIAGLAEVCLHIISIPDAASE
jgi:rare lipoprotein A